MLAEFNRITFKMGTVELVATHNYSTQHHILKNPNLEGLEPDCFTLRVFAHNRHGETIQILESPYSNNAVLNLSKLVSQLNDKS